jgi:hypothetical protein
MAPLGTNQLRGEEGCSGLVCACVRTAGAAEFISSLQDFQRRTWSTASALVPLRDLLPADPSSCPRLRESLSSGTLCFRLSGLLTKLFACAYEMASLRSGTLRSVDLSRRPSFSCFDGLIGS